MLEIHVVVPRGLLFRTRGCRYFVPTRVMLFGIVFPLSLLPTARELKYMIMLWVRNRHSPRSHHASFHLRGFVQATLPPLTLITCPLIQPLPSPAQEGNNMTDFLGGGADTICRAEASIHIEHLLVLPFGKELGCPWVGVWSDGVYANALTHEVLGNVMDYLVDGTLWRCCRGDGDV